MHILVTRPLPDAWDMRASLQRLGYEVTLSPLVEIVPQDLAIEQFEGASGLVATSQNGLRSLQLSGLLDKVKHLQVYCVGEATATLAKDLKLPNVTAGRGTAAELVPVIAERHKTRSGAIVHLAGDHLAYDLKGALAGKGVEVREIAAYKSVAATNLSPEAVAGLKSKRINVVTLMSPRTAAIWTTLAAKHGLQGALNNLVHVCLSQAVADKLQLAPPARVEVAEEPKLDEMLVLIKGLAAQPAQE